MLCARIRIMEESRMPKAVSEWGVKGKKGRGSPGRSTSWIVCVQEDTNNYVLQLGD